MIARYRSDNTFQMHQPFFRSGVPDYTEVSVNQPYRAVFYEFTAPYSFSSGMAFVPDGCVDILFVTGTDEPFMAFLGSPTAFKPVRGFPGCRCFGVRFKPGMYVSYQNLPLRDITDRELFFAGSVGVLKIFFTRLKKCFSLEQRIALFEDTFEPYVDSGTAGKVMQQMLCEINAARGGIHIASLAESMNYSERHISRLFQESMGMSPKTFARIVRFQHALDMLLSGRAALAGDYFMELGYADQAHFQREFKQYAGVTPKSFVRLR